jgi:hypothetical protein
MPHAAADECDVLSGQMKSKLLAKAAKVTKRRSSKQPSLEGATTSTTGPAGAEPMSPGGGRPDGPQAPEPVDTASFSPSGKHIELI